jgi:hypothetical protein
MKYSKAFEEVYEIFKLMPEELLKKIPIEFQKIIEEERDRSYFANIQEPIENCELTNETIILLGLIYREFLCSPEERKRLREKEARELKEVKEDIENNLKEKYDYRDIFKSKESEKIEQESTELIVVEKEKWYNKIFNLIKKLFRKE